MSATDVTQLKQRLHDLLMKLETFDVNLEDDFRSLDIAWSQLDQAWDGHAYQQFVGEWNGVRNMLRQYINLSNKYEQFLRERIEALEKFERSGGP
jgi:uncharacterized protein YukE